MTINSCFHHKLKTILLCCFSLAITNISATKQGKYFVLKNAVNQGETYEAQQYIKLEKGFKYTYQSTTGDFIGKLNPCLVFAPTDATYAKPDGTITQSADSGYVVGSIPGQFNVTPTGAATYTVPIECPAGVNGMQPNISLVYNSQAGNGIAGWGWSIGGLSSVNRVPKTYYYNGTTSAITLDKYGALMLDGQRFKRFTSYNNSVVYYPELNNNNTKIVAYYSDRGEDSLKVRYSNGKVATYGGTTDSKHTVGGFSDKVITWSISKISDVNNNIVEFTYESDLRGGNEFDKYNLRISEIFYGKNTSAKTDHFASIKFLYEDRPDSLRQYISGYKNYESKRLNSIIVSSNETEYAKYTLEYADNNLHSYLSAIDKKKSNTHLKKIEFNWGIKEISGCHMENEISLGKSDNYIQYVENEGYNCYTRYHPGDFNGDGYTDILLHEGFFGSNVFDLKKLSWCVYLNNGDFTFSKAEENLYSAAHNPNDYLNPGLMVLDRDLDGRNEFYTKALWSRIEGSVTVYYLKLYCYEILDNDTDVDRNPDKDFTIKLENKEDYEKLALYPLDYDGNHLIDILATKDNSVYEIAGTRSLIPDDFNGYKSLRCSDFNSDGKTDILAVFSGSSKLFCENQGVLWTFEDINYKDEIHLGDFNGDRLMDLLVWDDSKDEWYIYEFTGINFVKRLGPSAMSDYRDEEKVSITDFNNDGLTDIFFYKDKNRSYSANVIDYELHVLLSNGYGFEEQPIIDEIYIDNDSSRGKVQEIFTVGNFDSKAGADVLMTSNGFDELTLFQSEDTISSTKIYSIINNISDTIKISYGNSKLPMQKQSRVVTKEDASYTVTENRINADFVSQVRSALTDITYYYGGPCVDVGTCTYSNTAGVVQYFNPTITGGKGALGLKMFAARDNINGVTSISNYAINTTSRTLCQTESISLKNSDDFYSDLANSETYINKVSFSYISGSYTPGWNTNSYYMVKESERSKNYLLGTSQKRTYEYLPVDQNYDDGQIYSGTVTDIIYKDLNFSQFFNETSSNTPTFSKKGAWCNNVPDSVIITTTDINGDTFIKRKHYEYNDRGLLYKEIVDPYDENMVETICEYNDVGLPMYKSIKTNNKATRTDYDYTANYRFPYTVTDSVTGFSTTYSYNDTTGLLDSQTDHLGLKIKYKYNALDELVKTSFPDGTFAVSSLQWAGDKGPKNALYYSYEQRSGQAPIKTWYNKLGQELRSDTYGLNGKEIFVEKEYYNDGKLRSVTMPYFNEADKITAIEYKYDKLGRKDTIITQNGIATYSYNGLSTTVTDNNSTKTETMNAAGQLISSKLNGRKVTYTYWPSGLTKTSTPEGGKAVTTYYDHQGNRIKLDDPDAGIIESKYNGFGEVTWEKYFKSDIENNEETILTTYSYDASGRVDTINRNDKITTFDYDSKTGFLVSEKKAGHEISYTYDEDSKLQLGRVTTQEEKIDGSSYVSHIKYDAFGREQKYTYPSGYSTLNTYDENGNLLLVKDNHNHNIWEALEENAQGQLLRVSKGGKETTFGYYDKKGLPKSIVSNGIISEHYDFYNDGNLKYREDYISGYHENFTYENNQLKTWNLYIDSNPHGSYSMDYDAHGNIAGKSDIGYQMNYKDPNHVHAITSIEGNPDLVPDERQVITYTDFKKVESITEGDKELYLTYGLDHQRRKGIFYENGSVVNTRFYLGDYEEDRTTDGDARKVHYIAGGNGLAAIYVETNNVGQLYHAYTDYLGSLKALTDEAGNVVERYEFDPWGNRRDPLHWENKDERTNLLTDRGYTMHEHLDGFSLINMNGRVYDPTIARFLSPDPRLQDPGNWLNYNRYAYCLNNPLIYTDPDGEFVVTAFLIAAGVSMLIDYGIQVGMNYAQGYSGKDAWLNKVDFFDVAVSGAVGGLTAGWGASLKAGETIGKVGMFMVNNAKYVKAGEVLLTSAVDITGEGWQDVTFNQFGQRAVTGLATMAATDFISKQFNKTPELSIEQKVDNSIKDALESGNAIDRNGLTKSGRALQKHGSRPGSVFPKIPGKSLNAEGQNILGEILNSSSKVDVPNRFGGSDIFDLITGRGARFDANNNFMGFLEP